MSPSNREVIVQDDINEDGSLQHKDAWEKQKKLNARLLFVQEITDLIHRSVSLRVSQQVSLLTVCFQLLYQTFSFAMSQPTHRLVVIYNDWTLQASVKHNQRAGQIISKSIREAGWLTLWCDANVHYRPGAN